MEEITPGKLLKKMASDKNITVQKVAALLNRHSQSLYTSLNKKNMRTDLLIEMAEATGNDAVMRYNGKNYKLIKNKKDENE